MPTMPPLRNGSQSKHSVISLLLLCLSLFASYETAAKNSQGGFLDFNVYPYLSDVDNDNVITINAFSKLEHRFSYFSLTNFGNQQVATELSDITTFYTEQNVRWQISENSPLDLTLQMNFRTGEDNDRHRLGLRWRLNDASFLKNTFATLNLKYAINAHLIQFDNEPGRAWQLEHVFHMSFPYLSDRLYLTGFIDHTFGQELDNKLPKSPIVAEVQTGFNITESWFLIAEYRINEYRRTDINNLALGIEYKITW